MTFDSGLSILSNVRDADIRLDPYPHIVIKNALDRQVFEALEATFPADDVVVNGRKVQDTFFDLPASNVIENTGIAPLWRKFFSYHVSQAFFHDLIEHFGRHILELNPDLERRTGARMADFKVGMRPGGRRNPLAPGCDVSTECQFYVNYTRGPRAVRGPHVDAASELFAALLYFRQPADTSTGGDLQICRAKDGSSTRESRHSIRVDHMPAEVDPQRVTVVDTIHYAANTLVLFLNSAKSIHSVSPRSPTAITRRHINFCGDMRFDLFKIELPLRLKFRRTLENAPLAWRLARYL